MSQKLSPDFVPTRRSNPRDRHGFLDVLSRLVNFLLALIYYLLESIVLKFVPSKLRAKCVRDEVILITGAGSGIGRLLAEKFAGLGAKIVCWDINKAGVQETVEIIKNKNGIAHSYICNVADRHEVYATAEKVRQEIGKVSIIINNAGIVGGKRLMEISDDGIERAFAVNAISHFWIVKAFLPDMMAANHGHIVSIASLAGVFGNVNLVEYCASKFAAIGFAESLSLELYQEGYTGIHSTTVIPYFIDTGMFHGTNTGAFSLLKPNFVADEIVKAVLLNKETVILPWFMNVLVVLKNLIPFKLYRLASSELGILNAMDTFNPSQRYKKLE